MKIVETLHFKKLNMSVYAHVSLFSHRVISSYHLYFRGWYCNIKEGMFQLLGEPSG